MNWDKNPFEGESWGDKESAQKDVYPEPLPERPSTKELTNNLLDALIIALDKGNKEEIKAIEDQLILLRITNGKM
tara:strand:- start:229 stop:453 length:225 start_codon:yes stop_codon:yes gene_type:complete